MKILLVEPRLNNGSNYCETPSQALLILGTLAKQRGHDVTVVHRTLNDIPEGDWDVVGITTNTFQCKDAGALRDRCKHVIIGGPHAEYIESPYAVIGEGENKWLELLDEDANIDSIDDVPWPDYSLVDLSKFCGITPVGAYPSMAIMASRGCPNECIFCNTPKFWGRKVRYRDPYSVVDEVQRLRHDYGIKEIFFQDDTFNLNHDWASTIFSEIVRRGLNKDVLFRIACRVNERLLTQDFLKAAFRANVWSIFYGVESGSQKMLDNMKKHITVEESARAIELTHKTNMRVQASFIVGLPGESRWTLRETENFIKKTKPTMFGISAATPFPGTEFDRIVTEKGHKRSIPFEEYQYGKCVVRTDAMDFEEVRKIKLNVF